MRSTMKRCFATAMAVGAVAGVAAVPAHASKPISAAEYVKRADKVCRQADRALADVKQPTTEAELAPYFGQLVAVATPQVNKLIAIPLPTTHRDDAKTLRRLLGKQLAILTEANQAVQSGADVQTVLKAYDKQLAPLTKSQKRRWKVLGAKYCGSKN
jgi:hypothetical protein